MPYGKAHENVERSVHPDLWRASDGTLGLRDDVDLPLEERRFRRMWQNDAEREAFMQQVAREQSLLPPDVQEQVAGQTYGSDPYLGFLEYRRDIERMRTIPGNPQVRDLTGADIARMSLEEFDKFFDEKGQPKEGVTYYPSGRDVDVSRREGVDPFSARELRNR
jgi:hypothetical protein